MDVPQAGGETGPRLALSSLRMVTPDVGWATGWTIDRTTGGLLRTTDGGALWRRVTPPAIDPTLIESTFFLDDAHAWLIASPANSGQGEPPGDTVLRTTDGGQTWSRSAALPVTSGGPGWLDFIDADNGWLLANLGASAGSMSVAVYRTTDGGLTWQQQSLTTGNSSLSSPSGIPYQCNKTGISFADASTGWVTGHCSTGGVFFYVTHDAGRTWQRQTLTPPVDAPANLFADCDCETAPPVFAAGQHGMEPIKIFVSEHQAVVYVTGDGGRTWAASPLSTNQLLRALVFVSATDAWITDDQNLFVTRDGGRTWAKGPGLPDLQVMGDFSFVDLQHGWVTGGEQLYRTNDGGLHWTPITPALASAGP